MMRHWIATGSELPDTNDVRESVVDTLLQMARDDRLRSHIPVEAWEWLKKRPVLRYKSIGLEVGGWSSVLKTVQALGDIGLITSYLFVVWSEWNTLRHINCKRMRCMIRKKLDGIRAVGYRADLIQRLNYVLAQFDRGQECLYPDWGAGKALFLQAKQHYEEFRRDLLESDKKATNVLTSMSPRVSTRFHWLMHMYI